MKSVFYIKIEKISGKHSIMIEIKEVFPIHRIEEIKLITGYLHTENSNRHFVPYNRVSYDKLKAITGNIIIQNSGTSEIIGSETNNACISSETDESIVTPTKSNDDLDANIHTKKCGVDVVFNNMKFYISIAYNKDEIKFLKKLEKTYWSANNQQWISKATMENLTELQSRYELFEEDKLDKIVNVITQTEAPYKVNIYYTPQSMELVCIKIKGYNANHEIIKRVPQRKYDKAYQRWIIPNDKKLIEWVKAEYQADGAKVYDRLFKKGKNYTSDKKHIRTWLDNIIRKLPPHMSEVVRLYTNSLISGGYKTTSIRSYTTVLIKYMEALNGKSIQDSTVEDYEAYIAKLYTMDMSSSLVNIYNSAIKYCFKHIYPNTIIANKKLPRPRKNRALPKILSVNEIDRILRATSNIKHLSSSVQKVIKNCAAKANIGKRVTPHTMRHCFATHLMDSGVGIRYIQELLGHKDVKTTSMYTHVTNVKVTKIQSPLDDLMRGKDLDFGNL